MATNRCENIAPSLAKVYEMKTRLSNAKNAAKLLKRKARVFDLLLRDHSRDLIANTELMMEILREAFIVLAAARYFTGDFSAVVEECVDKADIKVEGYCERSMANARVFKILEGEGSKPWPYGGLSTGGHQVDSAKKLFKESLMILVHQVTLRNIILVLFDARVSTMRKSMVIEHMTVPRIQNTISYIQEQLDDMEREDMYRLKKIKHKIMIKNKKLREERNMDLISEEPKESVPEILDLEDFPMPAPVIEMPVPAVEMPAPAVEMPAPAVEMPASEAILTTEPMLIPLPIVVVLEKSFADKDIQVNLLKPERKPSALIEEGTLVVCDLLDQQHRCKCGKIHSLIDSVCSCEIKSKVVHEGHLIVSKCCSDLVEAACNKDEKGICSNFPKKGDPIPVENHLKPESKPATMTEEGTLVVCDLLDKTHRCKCGKINSLIDSVCNCEIKSRYINEGRLVISKCLSDSAEAACCRDNAGKYNNVQREAVYLEDAAQQNIGRDENQNLNHACDNKNEKETAIIRRKCPTCQKTKRSEDEHETR